jgi:hypothetical protein
MHIIVIFFDQCRQVEANADFRSLGEQFVRRLSLVAKQQGIEQFDINRADMTQLFCTSISGRPCNLSLSTSGAMVTNPPIEGVSWVTAPQRSFALPLSRLAKNPR